MSIHASSHPNFNIGRDIPIDARAVLNGVMYILSSGCQWAASQPRQDFDATVEQLAVGGVRHRFGLDRGVDGEPSQVLLLHRAAALRRGQALGPQTTAKSSPPADSGAWRRVIPV